MQAITRDFFYISRPPERRFKRLPNELTDTELKNKICEGERGQRENCSECELLSLCKYGAEIVSRGLTANPAKSA